jgi:hypothetical protein
VRVRPMTVVALLCVLATSGLGAPARVETRVAGDAQRVKLIPHLVAGQMLHYEFDLHTSVTSRSTGPIADPEGASHLEQSASATVRLEVIGVENASADSPGRLRLRATFEKSTATSRSDAFDPQAAAQDDQFRKLQGASIEFMLEPDGRVSDISGDMKNAFAGVPAARAIQEGLAAMSPPALRQGISIGQKWSDEHPIASAPLAGLAWRTESTYLRNEPCHPAASARPSAPNAPAAATEEMCAVILTRLEIVQHRAHGDLTPEEYRRNGLTTSGKWSGEAESLSDISLRTGLVTSVTQTGTEEMNFTVAAATGESRLHYAGQIRRQSEITLLPEAAR